MTATLSPPTSDRAPAEGAFIRTPDGERLYLEHFLPACVPRGVVLFVHGYSSYSGLYRPLAEALAHEGFVVTLFDVRGHGRSSGRRGFVRDFADYGRDLALMLAEARAGHGKLPVFAFAHSHGGLMTLDYLLRTANHGIDGAVVGAPFLGLKLKVPFYKLAPAGVLSRVWPTLALANEIRGEDVLRNEAHRLTFLGDPLVFHVATARWFTEARAAQARVLASASKLTTPLCLLIPEDDRLVDAEVSRAFAQNVPQHLLEVHTYPDLFHELFVDTGCEIVVSDALAWLSARCQDFARSASAAR